MYWRSLTNSSSPVHSCQGYQGKNIGVKYLQRAVLTQADPSCGAANSSDYTGEVPAGCCAPGTSPGMHRAQSEPGLLERGEPAVPTSLNVRH